MLICPVGYLTFILIPLADREGGGEDREVMTCQGRAIRRHLLMVCLLSPLNAAERGALSVAAQQRRGKVFVKRKTG